MCNGHYEADSDVDMSALGHLLRSSTPAVIPPTFLNYTQVCSCRY